MDTRAFITAYETISMGYRSPIEEHKREVEAMYLEREVPQRSSTMTKQQKAKRDKAKQARKARRRTRK